MERRPRRCRPTWFGEGIWDAVERVPTGDGSQAKALGWQAGLANDGTGGADREFFPGMGNDGDAASGVLVFGVAAALGHEEESVLAQNADDFVGTEALRH